MKQHCCNILCCKKIAWLYRNTLHCYLWGWMSVTPYTATKLYVWGTFISTSCIAVKLQGCFTLNCYKTCKIATFCTAVKQLHYRDTLPYKKFICVLLVFQLHRLFVTPRCNDTENTVVWERMTTVIRKTRRNRLFCRRWYISSLSQRRQSAKLFLQSSELGLPQPLTRRRVYPRGTLAGERGAGRVPIPTRDIHCGTLYIYVLCVLCH